MRLLRWIVILSSIAYWYSIFTMEAPPTSPYSHKRTFEEVTEEEEPDTFWPQQSIEQFSEFGTPGTSIAPTTEEIPGLRILSPEEVAQAISHLITYAKHAPNIQNAIIRADALLAQFPEINQPFQFEEIAKGLNKNYWLYVAAKLKLPEYAFASYLDKSLPSLKYNAVKKSIELKDYNTLQKLLNYEQFKKLFAQSNPGPHNLILSDLAKQKRRGELKILLDAGADPNSMYQDQSLLQDALPDLKTISMLIEKGASHGMQPVFINLVGTTNATIKNDPLYYPTLLSLIKSKAQLNTLPSNPNPLVTAAKTGDSILFNWLLNQGANPKSPVKWRGHLTTPEDLIMAPNIDFPNKQSFIDVLKGRQ